jgi:hypothetical protein
MFTYAGNRKLALFVEQEVKRDLEAKNEGPSARRQRPRAEAIAAPARPGTAAGEARSAPTRRRPPRSRNPPPHGLRAPAGGAGPRREGGHGRITLEASAGGARNPSPHPSAVIALVTQGDGREGPQDTRCRRCRGRACRAELDHAVRPRARHHAPDIGAELEPLLQGAGQGRASRAQARQGRRLQLAARRAPAHSRAAGRRGPPHPTTRHLAEGRPAAVVGGIAGFPGPPRLLPRSSACTLRYADKGGQSFMPKMSDSRRKKIQARTASGAQHPAPGEEGSKARAEEGVRSGGLPATGRRPVPTSAAISGELSRVLHAGRSDA